MDAHPEIVKALIERLPDLLKAVYPYIVLLMPLMAKRRRKRR